MAFPKDLLAEHETLVFDLKPHFVAIIPSVIWTVLALAAGIAADVLADGVAVQVILVVVIVGWAILAIPPFLRWQFTLFVLTTDRLITREGVIAKRSKEIPLERINDVAFNQTFIERMLKAGDLLIESAGETGQNRIYNVRDPEKVQLAIFAESEKNQDRMYKGSSTPTPPDIPEQIEALARLKEQGVLTEMEFETKKQELLKRL